jgi:C_GCAxxG_C_C family probable redox protein
MKRYEQAGEYFLQGYNCSQAVALAFADLCDFDKDRLLKIASSFGGGMGRLREVCGAVSGMFIVTGLLYGYDTPERGRIKAEHYSRIQSLAKRFEDRFGSIVCRELLGLNLKHDQPIPSPRTDDFYKKRPCKEIIEYAAMILDEYIKNEER